MQLIHNENLRANVRNESDRAMMMILTAVLGKGNDSNDNNNQDSPGEEESKLPSSTLTPIKEDEPYRVRILSPVSLHFPSFSGQFLTLF